MIKSISLFELNSLVKNVIESNMSDAYWVEAELSDMSENNGHCYMELIQKEEGNNTPIAKARAMIWRNTWSLIYPYFKRITGECLHKGMKVLLQVSPNFHAAYGFSWIVSDIDPTYTLGDMAKRRLDIINKLKDNGIYDLNKQLSLPMFTQRIAVISSATAAGYGDFCNQLDSNQHHLYFSTKLFPAIMQGEQVEVSIINALNEINKDIDNFDAVVIIRGGGATSDLSGFDTYPLAENVAQFPLPIITGIGHERDDTILDLVSNTRVKTPTAAAEFFICNLENVYNLIEDAKERIIYRIEQRMNIERMRIDKIGSSIPTLFKLVHTRQDNRLNNLMNKLTTNIIHKIESNNYHLNMLDQKIKTLDPMLMLKRGYSITLFNGKSVHDPKQLQQGDEITTTLEKGTIKSTIK